MICLVVQFFFALNPSSSAKRLSEAVCLPSLTPNLSAALRTTDGLRRVRLTTSSNDFDDLAISIKLRSSLKDHGITSAP